MSATPRQMFRGSDDVLLLSHVAQTPPWRHDGGVMEAWQHIAVALNRDTACSLTTLTAAASRGRFFRMVAQRRARQDKMLRRGTTHERQFQQKLELLDALIARMDAFDDETSLTTLLNGVGEDDAATLPLPEPLAFVPPPPLPQAPRVVPPKSSLPVAVPVPVPKSAPITKPSYVTSPAVTSAAKPPPRIVTPPLQSRPVTQHAPTRPAAVMLTEFIRVGSTRPLPADASTKPPAKKRAIQPPASTSPPTDVGGNAWERVIDRALDFMQRKLQLDQEAADADRAWRREEARARQNDLKAMREQTNRLIAAVLELAKSK